jgi:hypothetical protein
MFFQNNSEVLIIYIHCTTKPMCEIRNTNKILVGKPEGKRPLRRAGHRWEDKWEDLDWIHLAQYRD